MIGDDEPIVLDLPTGPFFRVEGRDIELNIFGQTLGGNFSLEQATTNLGADDAQGGGDDTTVLRIAASDVHLGLGDGTTDFVSLTDGSGFFVMKVILPVSLIVFMAWTVF